MTKRGVFEAHDGWRAKAGERLVAQLEIVSGVFEKALAMGRVADAERLLSPVATSFVELVHKADSAEDREALRALYGRLDEMLTRLEAASGKGWTRCLDVVKERVSKRMVPPRGRA